MNGGRVPPVVVKTLTAFLAVAALAGFVALAVQALWRSVQADDTAPDLGDANLYVTAALSALVGGIVAVAFGQKPPPDASVTLARSNLRSLTAVSTGRRFPDAGAVIGGAYAVVYVLLGLLAVAVWLARQDLAAEPVRALASTFLGLSVPIVRGFFDEG